MLPTRLGLVIKLFSIISIPDAIGGCNEIIHVSFVCMGQCFEVVFPMINSLLNKHRSINPVSIKKPMYRNTIHFHIIVEDETANDTENLCLALKSDAKCSIYNANDKVFALNWLTNKHHSGSYDLIKLLLPEILPQSLDKVILLDYDLIFLCDIIELWAVFKRMGKKQIFGLAEQNTDYYKNSSRALGLGYNLGLLLWDLKKTSETINWAHAWQEQVNATQPVRNALPMGAQDVVNAVLKKNPELVYTMDCLFNVQLTRMSKAKSRCYGDIKVLHYNTPSKIISYDIEDAYYFNTIRHIFS